MKKFWSITIALALAISMTLIAFTLTTPDANAETNAPINNVTENNEIVADATNDVAENNEIVADATNAVAENNEIVTDVYSIVQTQTIIDIRVKNATIIAVFITMLIL